MVDPVAAALATPVVLMHRGLVAWIAEAEQSSVQPAPQRRHAFDDRDSNRVTRITGTHDPDDAMVALIDRRLALGPDPEHLEPIRIAMTTKLGKEAAWYSQGSEMFLYPEEWEPLATRLGDLIGDQVAANALAMCCIRHARLAYASDEQTQHRRKAARERWRRLAAWYVRVLDEQPTKEPTSRVVVQSVEGEGERRFG